MSHVYKTAELLEPADYAEFVKSMGVEERFLTLSPARWRALVGMLAHQLGRLVLAHEGNGYQNVYTFEHLMHVPIATMEKEGVAVPTSTLRAMVRDGLMRVVKGLPAENRSGFTPTVVDLTLLGEVLGRYVFLNSPGSAQFIITAEEIINRSFLKKQFDAWVKKVKESEPEPEPVDPQFVELLARVRNVVNKGTK